MQRRTILLIGFAFSLLLCGVAALWAIKRNAASSGEPDVAPLREALTLSAERTLSAGSIADRTIRKITPRADLDGEIERLKKLATAMGGTAFATERDNGVVILAQIPAGKVAEFCTAAGATKAQPVAAPVAAESFEYVEIVLEPS